MADEQNKASGKKRLKIVCIIFAVLLILYIIAGSAVTFYEMKLNFCRSEYPSEDLCADYLYDHYENDYPRTELSFMSGENELKGWIYGEENTRGLIVFSHGIGTGHEMYINVLVDLVKRGWKVFAYDATGCCESQGKDCRGLAQSALDLNCALTFAENDDRLNDLPVFVLGHSWGGYAAAAVLNFDHDIKASVSLSGYDLPDEEMYFRARSMFGNAGVFTYPFLWIYDHFIFEKDAVLSAVDGINKSGIPVLVLHGTQDEIIGFNESSIIAKKEKITNPLTEYVIFDEEFSSTHSDYFTSEKSYLYKKEIHSMEDDINNIVRKEEWERAMSDLYKTVDKEIYNEGNPVLMETIDGFFGKYAE